MGDILKPASSPVSEGTPERRVFALDATGEAFATPIDPASLPDELRDLLASETAKLAVPCATCGHAADRHVGTVLPGGRVTMACKAGFGSAGSCPCAKFIATATPSTDAGAGATGMRGCGNHSCVIAKPNGVGTNGACTCPEWKLRARVTQLSGALTTPHLQHAEQAAEIASLKRAVEVRDQDAANVARGVSREFDARDRAYSEQAAKIVELEADKARLNELDALLHGDGEDVSLLGTSHAFVILSSDRHPGIIGETPGIRAALDALKSARSSPSGGEPV